MKYQIIHKEGEAILVEWEEENGLHRSVLPLALLQEEDPSQSLLASGIPWGQPWEMFLGTGAGERIAQRLRAQGIWTREDLVREIRVVQSIIQQTYAEDLRQLLDGSRSIKQGG